MLYLTKFEIFFDCLKKKCDSLQCCPVKCDSQKVFCNFQKKNL